MNENVKTVLLVDDDVDFLFQQKTELGLEFKDWNILTAESKNKANEILKETTPDLAIIDLMMEEMDAGLVLAYDIKKKNKKTPVIMVTAVTNQTGLEFDSVTPFEKTWVKADTIFTKPVRTEQLVREIRRLLN